jgi:DNA-binding NarL/FixJ family response regulator
MTKRVLCVDPDETARAATVDELRAELAGLGVDVEAAGTAEAAVDTLGRETAAVVTEYDLPDGTGFDVIESAADVCPDACCVVYTDADPDDIDTDALRETVAEYVGKESVFGAERLAELVRTAIETGAGRSYPLPQSEAERVAALATYDLDDEALLESLDRITGLAKEHFGVETASINIITEHSQEFLACHGPAEEWETIDREDSICTFTILEDDDVMTVEDVTEDPRFESRSDALVDMGIRSYMGANLVTAAGLKIGPLCVYDDEPRSFSAADREYIRSLAEVAMELIELHARLAERIPAGGER